MADEFESVSLGTVGKCAKGEVAFQVFESVSRVFVQVAFAFRMGSPPKIQERIRTFELADELLNGPVRDYGASADENWNGGQVAG